jgi:3-methyladenine DNA glycosylase Tag
MNIQIRPIQPADYAVLDDFLYHAIFIPATTDVSDKISKDLKKMGMNFVGSTIIYSFMQATGMVNDHFTDCFVYGELQTEVDYD